MKFSIYDRIIRYSLKNSNKISSKQGLVLITAGTIIFSITTLGILNVQAANMTRFVAGLTGDQEVPPVKSNYTGEAYFLPINGNKIMYGLNVTGLVNSTDAGIYIGKQGQNGNSTAIVTLFRSTSPESQVNGTFAQGNITSLNFQGSLKGKALGELVRLMNNGDTFVNVHTAQKPGGEVRGQIGAEGTDESGTMLGQGKVIPPVEEKE